VAGIGVWRFAMAIAIGRGIRYFGEGMLAVRYGDGALTFLHEHGRTISLGLVGVLAAAFIGYLLWRKARTRQGR
jgi:membrane protein DedA with SNARE-associated domain